MTAWPEKMITQAEAFAKAANWPVAANWHCPDKFEPEHVLTLQCMQEVTRDGRVQACGQSCGQLRRGAIVYNGTLDEMLSMVLRHMVQAHDMPLNTRPRPGEPYVNTPPGAFGQGAKGRTESAAWLTADGQPLFNQQDNGPSDGSTP